VAVATTRFVNASGLYVPYHQARRATESGLVGTLDVDAEATGAAGGGEVSITIAMRREEFGFPLLWVPTKVSSRDNLAAAEEVAIFFISAGNRRLSDNVFEVLLAVRQGTTDAAVMENIAIPIEGVSETQQGVLGATWSTNTDTKTYHLHAFGPVYDLQLIARLGLVDPMLAGIR